MAIDENLVLGIDLGIGSCGWALLNQGAGSVVAMGVRTFDVPETDKERTPTNQLRRQHRGLRRVLRRRRQRMASIRRLFRDGGLIAGDGSGALRIAELDPWELRASGLDRRLTGPELAVALGHIAKHRGFRSNSKRERGANAADESSKMLNEIAATRDRLAQWRTVGEMFARDERYADRKRNREGDYTRSILRDDQEREVRVLFDVQRRAGNPLATPELEATFIALAFSQRPLQDSEHLVGSCPFESDQKRAAKRAPSFERFRLLSRLAALRIADGRQERPLTTDERRLAEAQFGRTKKYSYTALRKAIGLHADLGFAGVPADGEKNDFVARAGAAAEGTASLREAIVSGAGEVAWGSLLNAPAKLDAIAAILTFRDDIGSIRNGLAALELESGVLEAVMAGVENGRAFQAFKGAGHISAKACRTLIPRLQKGLVYSEACSEAGYEHAARPRTKVAEIGNPIARKALIEAVKQVKAIVQEYGLPGAIHIELAREVGKSKEERDEIRAGIEKRNKQKDRLREEFTSVVGLPSAGAEDLLRFELWKEQNGRCLYTDRSIHPSAIVAADNSVQVDHILPWSRSGDDSFINKTLCVIQANQDKRGRTPFEWFGDEADRWQSFAARVETIKVMKGRKKRNYLLKDARILEDKFRPRNLNDTRYAARLLADELRYLYPEGDGSRVRARPGPLTDRLRRAWGIQDLKKGPDGGRVADDRHHALDALVVAATTESALQRLTRAFQEAERRGSHRDFTDFPPPWHGFAAEARAHYETVFVSRAERRRARGQGHAATVRAIEETGEGPAVYERRNVDALTLADLARIKDAERNHRTVAALREWIEAGKPKDRRPLSPKGDPIAKVRLRTNKKLDVLVRNGAAERGEMTRVDVFRRQNRKGTWEYFLVPIYPHQIFDRKDWPEPPNKAIQANTEEAEWPEVNADYEFLWSIYPLSYIEVVKPNGEVIRGYSRGASRSTGAFTISPAKSLQEVRSGIGTRTLTEFRKFHVDRLGRRFEIDREQRTWRGVACT